MVLFTSDFFKPIHRTSSGKRIINMEAKFTFKPSGNLQLDYAQTHTKIKSNHLQKGIKPI